MTNIKHEKDHKQSMVLKMVGSMIGKRRMTTKSTDNNCQWQFAMATAMDNCDGQGSVENDSCEPFVFFFTIPCYHFN